MVVLLFLLFLTVLCWRLFRRRRQFPSVQRIKHRKSHRLTAVLITIGVIGMQTVVMAPQAFAVDCAHPPPSESPNSGLVGVLDPVNGNPYRELFQLISPVTGEPYTPAEFVAKPEHPYVDTDDEVSRYMEYGYAGMIWHSYDPDCEGVDGTISATLDMDGNLDLFFGNAFFDAAKVIVAATNGLDALIQTMDLGPLTMVIKAASEKMYNNIYVQFFGIVAIALAIAMLYMVLRGNLAAVSKRGLYALGALWLAASSFILISFYGPVDNAIKDGVSAVRHEFVTPVGNEAICGDECSDLTMRVVFHNQIVYKNWLRGQFGGTEGLPSEVGHKFLHLGAFERTFGEEVLKPYQNIAIDGDKTFAMKLTEARHTKYKAEYGALPPSVQATVNGDTNNRTGTGILAFIQSLMYLPFQLISLLGVVAALVLLRLFIVAAPLLGLIALIKNDILHRVLRTGGAVVFGLVLLAALAGGHVALLQAIFNSSLPLIAQMALGGLITVILIMFAHPVRQLMQIVKAPVKEFGEFIPSMPGGVFSRLRGAGQPTQQDNFWDEVRGDENRGLPAGVGARPENNPRSSNPFVPDIVGKLSGKKAANKIAGGSGGRGEAASQAALAAAGPYAAIAAQVQGGNSQTKGLPSGSGRGESKLSQIALASKGVPTSSSSDVFIPSEGNRKDPIPARVSEENGKTVHTVFRASTFTVENTSNNGGNHSSSTSGTAAKPRGASPVSFRNQFPSSRVDMNKKSDAEQIVGGGHN